MIADYAEARGDILNVLGSHLTVVNVSVIHLSVPPHCAAAAAAGGGVRMARTHDEVLCARGRPGPACGAWRCPWWTWVRRFRYAAWPVNVMPWHPMPADARCVLSRSASASCSRFGLSAVVVLVPCLWLLCTTHERGAVGTRWTSECISASFDSQLVPRKEPQSAQLVPLRRKLLQLGDPYVWRDPLAGTLLSPPS